MIRKIFQAVIPTLVFFQNYSLMTGNKALGLGFFAIWLIMIWSGHQLNEKYQIIERFLRLTEIGFFLLPISAVVYTLVMGARAVSHTSSDMGQAGAAIGTAIGGTFVIGLMFVIGVTGGIILHLITGSYAKKAEKSETKQLEIFSNKNGVALSIVGVFALALIVGTIVSPPATDSTLTTHSTANSDNPAVQQPLLELEGFTFTGEYGYDILEGTVKNISDQKLGQVEALGQFYDKDGNFVKSADTLIEYDPILPGQISPFKVMTSDNPAIQKANVSFKYLIGGEIPTRKPATDGKK